MTLLATFQDILATVMVRIFFGSDIKGKTLDGQKISQFVSELVADGQRQSQSPLVMLLGPKFTDLGIRELDRDLNRRLKLFRAFAYDLVKNKFDELKKSNFQSEDKNNGNMIEQLYLAKSK
jgi:hypothetical protein